MAPALRVASSHRRTRRRRSVEQRQLLPILRGLKLLSYLHPFIFGHEVRNLSVMLRCGAGETQTGDEAARRHALELADLLWSMYPPELDPDSE